MKDSDGNGSDAAQSTIISGPEFAAPQQSRGPREIALAPPYLVARIGDELAAAGIWHNITRNQRRVTSCREAASARRRLGMEGIPLWDELKTHLGAYETLEGRRYVAVHCRAHQNRDDTKVAKVLDCSEVRRIDADELAAVFGVEYGRVNPFLLAKRSDVVQLFDEGVLSPYPAPHTMMTNAGDLSWGIEFRPAELINFLQNAKVCSLVADSACGSPAAPVLGILTGNGPESGMELWRRINAAVQSGGRQFRGDINFPTVTVASIPGMGMSMELALREQEVHEVVLQGIDVLATAGATVIGVACNTTQYFSPYIRARCQERDITFVSLVDATRKQLRRKGAKSFDLIGIGPVVDLERWSDFRRLTDEFTVVVPPSRYVDEITTLAYNVKAKEQRLPGGLVAKLHHVLSKSTTTQTILIALTELSVTLSENPKLRTRLEAEGKVIIDSLTALAEEMADFYLGYRGHVNAGLAFS